MYYMDHHGVLGSEVQVGPAAEYESVSLSADRKKLVFCAPATSGYFQIFTAQSDGSEVRQITNDIEDHWEAQFSPDGSQIVYVRGYGNLGLMKSSGGPERTINTDRFYIDHPTLLASGKILFEGFDSEIDALFAVNSDGTDLMSFYGGVNPNPYYYENVAVSPDETKIAFSRRDRANGNEDVFLGDFHAAAIDTFDTVITDLRQLTNTAPVAENSFDPMFIDDRIVFMSFGDTDPPGAGAYQEVYSMKFDGSDLQRLTRNMDYEWFLVPYYYYY